MKQVEAYVSRAFVISCAYLLAGILLWGFILPATSLATNTNLPAPIAWFLSVTLLLLGVTAGIAALIVLSCAVIIPGLQLLKEPKQRLINPAGIAAATLLLGLIYICLNALYVKVMTCTEQNFDAWYCHVDGKGYIGLLASAFFLSSLVGSIAWVFQKLTKGK